MLANGTISKIHTLESSIDGINYTKVAEGTWEEVNVAEKVVEFAPTHAPLYSFDSTSKVLELLQQQS